MATVRETSPGRWELRVYIGKDPLTGRKRQTSRTVDATGKRDATRQANAWEIELRDGDLSGDGGTFGQLCAAVLKHKERSWSPATLKENTGIVRRYLSGPISRVDVKDISTRTIDTLYATLTERGGQCRHRPCPRRLCNQKGHVPRCERKDCTRPPCELHSGACADWTPCKEQPCAHGSPLAISTVNRIHVVVAAMLQQAVIWGWRRRNPAEHADPGTVLVEEVDPPEDTDVIALMAEAEDNSYALATYLALAIEAGARRGAQHATRWSYWSGPLPDDTSVIRFPKVISIGPDGPIERPATRTKRSGRKVTLGPHVTAMLVTLHDMSFERALAAEAQLPTDAFIFTDDVLGQVPWRPDSTSRKFRLLRHKVNISSKTQLRHLRDLMATKLLSVRVNPKVVGERGGWQKLATMLDRYAHFLPADDAEAAGIVDRIYNPLNRSPT